MADLVEIDLLVRQVEHREAEREAAFHRPPFAQRSGIDDQPVGDAAGHWLVGMAIKDDVGIRFAEAMEVAILRRDIGIAFLPAGRVGQEDAPARQPDLDAAGRAPSQSRRSGSIQSAARARSPSGP